MAIVEKAPPVEVVTVANGYRQRWGFDEPDPENVPAELAFSTSVPGGADTISVRLNRSPDQNYPDNARLTELRLGRAGGRAMDFRIEETPRTSGLEESVEVGGVGYRAALEDREDARAIFVDRDLGKWETSPPYVRAALLYAFGVEKIEPGSVEWSSGGPQINLYLRGPQTTATNVTSEAYFYGQGIPLGDLYYAAANSGGPGAGTCSAKAFLSRDVYFNPSGSATSHELRTLSDPDEYLSTACSPWALDGTEHSAGFVWQSGGTAATDRDYVESFANVAVYGAHGLPKYGDAPGGFYTGQMIEWIVENLTDLQVGEIDLGTFLHVHASFMDPTTPLGMIEELVRVEPLYDWAVYRDRRLDFVRRGSGRRWRARIGEADLQATGETTARLYNEVAVKVDDPSQLEGTIVGPPGSGYATTDSRLRDADPLNPVTAAGVTRRALLDIGEGTLAGAIEVGARFLEETKALDNSGEATLVGLVTDETGVAWPVDEVRAGDEIAFTDARDTSYRRIVATDYRAADQTNSLSLDAPPETIEALLNRLSARLIPLG